MQCHREGRLAEAERLYGQILQVEPDHPEALMQLGVVHLQQDRAIEALPLIEAAAARSPHAAEAHATLGAVLQVLGRLDEAIAAYRAAIDRDPAHVEAQYGLATALHAIGRLGDAVTLFVRTLAADPEYIEAHCGGAAGLQAQKRLPDAMRAYERALALDPTYVEARYGLATAMHASRRLAEATSGYEAVLAAAPNHVLAWRALGIGRRAQERHEDAVSAFEHALALDPSQAETYLELGITLQELGRLDAARTTLRRAVEQSPRNPRCLFALVNAERMTPDSPWPAHLETLTTNPVGLDDDAQILLRFALAKARDDLSDSDASFRHQLEGNALKRRRLHYDESATLAALDRMRVGFTEPVLRGAAEEGHSSLTPVFIVGMPRSGSTLVEQILASHPGVLALGERDDWQQAMIRVHVGQATPPPNPNGLRALGDAYLSATEARAAAAGHNVAAADRITDKTLINFAHLGLIAMALPHARAIHIRRDPVDTCLSCFSKLFDEDQPYAYELGELGRYYAAYARLMSHWRQVLPDRFLLEIHYEALVADLDTQARRIVAHCGLVWDPSCLAFHKTERTVRTASSVQVRQPLYATAVSRWRPDPTLLRPLLEGLGQLP